MEDKDHVSPSSPPWRRCLIQDVFQHAQAELLASAAEATRGPRPSSTKAASSPAPSTRSRSSHGHASDTLVVSLDEQTLDESYSRYSRTLHMVLLDPSYHVFASPRGRGALLYKVAQRTLVVVGDPMCCKGEMGAMLDELQRFRSARRLRLAFMGVSESFLEHAHEKRWASLRIGRERVLNPLANKVLDRRAGKRILSQNRQLLDPDRFALRLAMYAPGVAGIDAGVEAALDALYGDWCAAKLAAGGGKTPQAFITSYQLFSHRSKTAFLLARDRDGRLCGMAMLREVGAHAGFHIDPCIAAPDAPRGTTDLLVVTAMRLLRRAGLSYLSLGVEPASEVGGGGGGDDGSRWRVGDMLANAAYRAVTRARDVQGKRAYYDKFHPDPALESSLYVVLPSLFAWHEVLAVMKVAHVQARRAGA
ncbi:uncharacterized protein UV8b_00282 [Ustilaginoidea virens]|uniref:Phosphatidylglycerol lysyltransferase C-terminal domain-containing protein n=1 Tax=Ustilaginoidea virens TaxID=1159556 RepID=A0A063C3H4_USTVR|nr:uncharacterized protein UV8b_00282 [Ustilaginoidea virens]QUC16041.1 hypothetical protein UV8b_00282 [Ustilaginoidea virens]GAO16360.1 hypothetical protein UVI_02049840 [Ustilaginoidea virens]